MIDTTWTHEDAAVAADAAMDRGVPYADLWRYFPAELVQQLVVTPTILCTFTGQTNTCVRTWAAVGTRMHLMVHVGAVVDSSAVWRSSACAGDLCLPRAWIRVGSRRVVFCS